MSTIALLQLSSTPDQAENLMHIADLIRQAAKAQAKLVVLPEMFAGMAPMGGQKKYQEPYGDGVVQRFLSEQAKQHALVIVAGTFPIESADAKRPYASCLVYSEQGDCIARYDKIHLFDTTIGDRRYQESKDFMAGDELVMVETSVGCLGLAVCYDLRFPEMFRTLRQQGAEIFILPSAFTIETGIAHWEVLARARAIENGCYMLACDQVGEHYPGRTTFGHTMAIDPWGNVLTVKEAEVGIVLAEINLSHLRDVRNMLPSFDHAKLGFRSQSGD